jgi:hypothetical protein
VIFNKRGNKTSEINFLGIRAGSRGSLSLCLGLSHRANEELRQTAPSLMRLAAGTSKNNILYKWAEVTGLMIFRNGISKVL